MMFFLQGLDFVAPTLRRAAAKVLAAAARDATGLRCHSGAVRSADPGIHNPGITVAVTTEFGFRHSLRSAGMTGE
jgi:hypothetical protein